MGSNVLRFGQSMTRQRKAFSQPWMQAVLRFWTPRQILFYRVFFFALLTAAEFRPDSSMQVLLLRRLRLPLPLAAAACRCNMPLPPPTRRLRGPPGSVPSLGVAPPLHDPAARHVYGPSLQCSCGTSSPTLDTSLAVVSLDVSAAYDLVSREAMLRGLQAVPGANAMLRLPRLWCGAPSRYIWRQGSASHVMLQGEGGEQGNPMMLGLCCLALHPAGLALGHELRPDEGAVCYLDDVYILCPPHRVSYLHRRLEAHLHQHARLRLNAAKTTVWNQAGSVPSGLAEAGILPEAWCGDPTLPLASRGGVPLGTPEFINAQLQLLLVKHAEHAGLLARLPMLRDARVAWVSLLYCAAPRAQYASGLLPAATATDLQPTRRRSSGMWGCPRLLYPTGPQYSNMTCGLWCLFEKSGFVILFWSIHFLFGYLECTLLTGKNPNRLR